MWPAIKPKFSPKPTKKIKLNISIDLEDYINKLEEFKTKLKEVKELQDELNNTVININLRRH